MERPNRDKILDEFIKKIRLLTARLLKTNTIKEWNFMQNIWKRNIESQKKKIN